MRPIENLSLASKRKYDVVGITMEAEYDEMTESDEERQVLKLSKSMQAAHKEMKDLMTVQGRLKGQVPGFGAGIHAYVTGRYPGVPSELAKPYVIPEEGEKADLLECIPPIQIEHFLQAHDEKIPQREVIVRPGRKGISMSIDPNSDDEIYEVNQLEDSIQTVIKLIQPKPEDKEGSADVATTEGAASAMATEKPPTVAESSKTDVDERVLVPDVISQDIADKYTEEQGLDDEEPSDAETISSTSTADFDRDEVEDLLSKLSSCQTALSVHYNKLNELVPHMTNAQVANYLGKTHIMPLVKAEARSVSKVYVGETTSEENKFVVRGDTHEEKLQGLIDTVPAHQLLLAIAIGDIHLNRLSYAQASEKYEFSKSRIQRAISGKSEHKKGGKQYKQERKRQAPWEGESTEGKKKKSSSGKEVKGGEPSQVETPAEEEMGNPPETLPDLVEGDEEDFPSVDIDA